MSADSPSSSDLRFENVDWDVVDGSESGFRARTKAFVASFVLFVAAFVYDFFVVGSRNYAVPALGWDVALHDWLFMFSLLVFAFYAVVPVVANRRYVARYWARFRTNRLAVVSLAYLAVFLVVGTLGPLFVDQPDLSMNRAYQPPVFTSASNILSPNDCLGAVTNGQCHGTLAYPLGTTSVGADLIPQLLYGMRVSLEVALVTSVLIIPIATTVGTVAGYVGGLVDELLMGYIDFQQTIPAIVVYLLLIFLYGRRFFIILLVFGLLSWGGITRLVRSEVLQRREEAYVLAAKSAGAGHGAIIRRHILPNVSSTVVTATTRLVPTLVLAEAAISFLNIGHYLLPSFGQAIAIELRRMTFLRAWWTTAIPVVFLAATVVAISLVGDGLRDALDPKVEG